MPNKILESLKSSLSEEPEELQNSKVGISDTYRDVYAKRYHSVKQVMQKLIKQGQSEAFYMFDPKSADERITLWREHLPRIELFYAVKTNPSQAIIDQCLNKNTGFDVASGSEIDKVMASGGKPEDCIFASPIKKPKDLLLAKKFGIKKMTFDCSEELHKIKKHFPEAECVLRIATEKTTALYNLSEKFGAFMTEVPELLKLAKELELKIKGVAFHTGSGGVTFDSYKESLLNTREVFDKAKELGLPPLDLVDIGGGFTMVSPEQHKNFDFVAPLIAEMVDKLFPEDSIRFIAEPGRFVAESVVYHASTIIGTKELATGHRHYYLDTGIFQAYGLRPYGEEAFIDPLEKSVEAREHKMTTWWGQTCDSCDWIIKDKSHPSFKTGEWVVTKDHGAYNMELGNNFNGYETPKIFYV